MIDLGFMFLVVLQRKKGRIIFEFTSRMHSNAQRLFQAFLTDECVTNLIELTLMTALSQMLRNFGGHSSAVEFSENFKNIYTLLPSTTQKKIPIIKRNHLSIIFCTSSVSRLSLIVAFSLSEILVNIPKLNARATIRRLSSVKFLNRKVLGTIIFLPRKWSSIRRIIPVPKLSATLGILIMVHVIIGWILNFLIKT